MTSGGGSPPQLQRISEWLLPSAPVSSMGPWRQPREVPAVHGGREEFGVPLTQLLRAGQAPCRQLC